MSGLTLQAYQDEVDNWIRTVGVRYYSELTNTAVLMEEVGEVARIMARTYGDQSAKSTDTAQDLADEFADVLFVLTCLANQTGVDLAAAARTNLVKKTSRDRERHAHNPKLREETPMAGETADVSEPVSGSGIPETSKTSALPGVYDLRQLIGFKFPESKIAYTARDVCLYGLSVGAASHDPVDPRELQYVYELSTHGFQPLPTLPATFLLSALEQLAAVPALAPHLMNLLHGEHYLELKRPLPTEGVVVNQGHISQVYDKGSGALILVDIDSRDAQGESIAFNQASLFMRGLGGFGGERGPANTITMPQRAADFVVTETTGANQALLYRLSSGDRNPLHADPSLAAMLGFERPILHGLCTFGFAGRAVLAQCAGNDALRFKSIRTRFSKHVFPGETLRTEIWANSETSILFQCRVEERDEIVLSQGVVELHPQLMETVDR
jgi:acyl dehydratase/NTP pyrophosphatase (non-canonical NTP hydrolase)